MTTTSLVAPISLSTDLLTGAEWSPAHTRELLHLAADIKARPGRYASTLHGKFIALIFEKPSLRTRVTFDVGIQSMGGAVVFLDHTQASRSEEHTSELQSHSDLVCRLLLENKNNIIYCLV